MIPIPALGDTVYHNFEGPCVVLQTCDALTGRLTVETAEGIIMYGFQLHRFVSKDEWEHRNRT